MNRWKCQDGRELLASEMEDDHILNVMRMCYKKRYVSPSTVMTYLSANIDAMGECAQEAFARECEDIFGRRVLPILDDLEAEAKKRGIAV